MSRSQALLLSVPLMVFAATQASYRIYFPYLPNAVAYWRAPAGSAGYYYSPFLSNQPEINDQNFTFFWICLALNATFYMLWISAGLWLTFRRWSEDIKRRRIRQGDDRLLAQMSATIVLCFCFLLADMPGQVHGVYEAVMVHNIYIYVYVYSIYVYLTIGIAAFMVVYGLALRASRQKESGPMQ